jgi:hypothetical protein
MDSWFSHFRALPFHNIQMSWLMQLQDSRLHNPLVFYKTYIQTSRFLLSAFFASSEFSRYKKLVSAFPRFSKDDIFQSFSFAILQVVVFHVSGFLSSQLSWFSLSLGPEGTLLYIRDWLPYTCVGCRLRGSASSCI